MSLRLSSRTHAHVAAGISLCLRLLLLFCVVVIAFAHSASLRPRPGSVSSQQRQEQEVRALEPAKPIEREMAGGDTHLYEIRLAAGQYMSPTFMGSHTTP